MKKIISYILILVLLGTGASWADWSGSTWAPGGGAVAGGDNPTDRNNYKFMGQMQAVLTQCVAMFGWLNVGNGNTEVNQCNNGIAAPTTDNDADYSAHATWDTARGIQGSGYYLDFDGTHMLTIADDDDFSFDGTTDTSFSIGFWIRPSAFNQQIIGKYATNKQEWKLGTGATETMVVQAYDVTAEAATNLATAASSVVVDTWLFVVWVRDIDMGGCADEGCDLLYFNGVYVVAGTDAGAYVNMDDDTSEINIGGIASTASYTGDLGVVFITKEALAPSQVSALYNIGRSHYGL
jgi:hypothetical protein